MTRSSQDRQRSVGDLRHLRLVTSSTGSTAVAAARYQHVMADQDAAIARELNRLIEGA